MALLASCRLRGPLPRVVERRVDPRYEINAAGELAKRKSKIVIENISRGGAMLTSAEGLMAGERDTLRWSGAEAAFRVTSASGGIAHVMFDGIDSRMDAAITAATRGSAAFPDHVRKAS